MWNQNTAASPPQIKEENIYKSSFFHHEILPEICEWLSPFSFQEPKKLKAQEVQSSSSSQWIQWEWRVLLFITRPGCRGSAGWAVINCFQPWLHKLLPRVWDVFAGSGWCSVWMLQITQNPFRKAHTSQEVVCVPLSLTWRCCCQSRWENHSLNLAETFGSGSGALTPSEGAEVLTLKELSYAALSTVLSTWFYF